VAVAEMTGPARQVVHGLKYLGVRPLAAVMAERMATLLATGAFDVAAPIPLHASRVRVRGFNQAELLLQRLNWPVAEGALRRVRRTRTQVGLRQQERRKNVDGAFVYEGARLDGLRVVLVDDVVTTGATADECAAVLKEQGARSVVVAAFARASYMPGSNAPLVT
jgi:ComF family protein